MTQVLLFIVYQKDYMAFRLSHRVIGVYDDHDFGLNNADRNKPNRELSAEKYLDFLDISPQDPLRMYCCR